MTTLTLDREVTAIRDREADFRDFYARHYGDVAGYALALTSSRALADEVAQEAMTAVYSRWSGLREPRAYAFRVARNTAQSHWKAQHRELATWSQLVSEGAPSPDGDPHLWDLVRRLPPPLAEVVVLHYVCDLRVEDVAAAVRRPTGTVKRRLSEARALLATTLEELR